MFGAMKDVVTRMLAGQRPIVFGDGEQSRDFCYIENVVQANMLSLTTEKLGGEVVNIACGERITLNEIVRLINTNLGTGLQVEHQPPRVGDVRHSLADLSAARRVIGYEPLVMFAAGLERSVEWYTRNPE